MAEAGEDEVVDRVFYETILPNARTLTDAQVVQLTKKLLEYQLSRETPSAFREAVESGMVLTGWTRDNPLVPKSTLKGVPKRIQGSQQKPHNSFDSDLAHGLRIKRIERMLIGKTYNHVAVPASGPGVDEPISRETGNPIVFY